MADFNDLEVSVAGISDSAGDEYAGGEGAAYAEYTAPSLAELPPQATNADTINLIPELTIDGAGAQQLPEKIRPNVVDGSVTSSSDERYQQLSRDLKFADSAVRNEVERLGLTEQFKNLPSGKDGSFSEQQLAFLKEHSKKAFFEAQNFNAALPELQKLKEKMGSDAANTNRTMKPVKEGETSNEPQKESVEASAYLKADVDRTAELTAETPPTPEEARELEIQAALELKSMSPELTKRFMGIPMGPNETYTKQHLEFLKTNAEPRVYNAVFEYMRRVQNSR